MCTVHCNLGNTVTFFDPYNWIEGRCYSHSIVKKLGLSVVKCLAQSRLAGKWQKQISHLLTGLWEQSFLSRSLERAECYGRCDEGLFWKQHSGGLPLRSFDRLSIM